MKIIKGAVIQAATIQIEDWEESYSENRYAVLWKAKDEENRYSARSLQDAEEYYEYRCLLVGAEQNLEKLVPSQTGRRKVQGAPLYPNVFVLRTKSGRVFLTPEMLPLATIMINHLDGASSHFR